MADFARRPEEMLALQESRAAALADEVRTFVAPRGDERALDAGTGTGALAFALAASVREVVAVDTARDLLDAARTRAPANVSLVEADATQLPFDDGAFDLAGTLRVLHHLSRPDLAIAELARVTRRGGAVLVADQLGDEDPAAAAAGDRFEQARDASHTRLLPDSDLRALFAASGLVVRDMRRVQESRDLDAYLALAGCVGEDADRARALAPGSPYRVELGWYLLERR
jgi:SAM-dependent methyltransferase